MGRSGTKGGIFRFMILLLCLAAIVFIGTEIFQVEKFTVIGSNAIDDDVIINMSGISYGDNVFKINRKQVKSRIESNSPFPVVQAVSIKLPDEVIISIEERIPVAVIPYLSSYLVIDTGGFVLDIIKQDSKASLPIVEGIHISSLKKGSMLNVSESDDYQYKILTRILEAVAEWEAGDLIQTVFLDNPDDIFLLTRDGIKVTIGQAVELDKKMGWLKSEAYTKLLQGEQKGILDVSVPGKAVFHPDPLDQEDTDDDSEEGSLDDSTSIQQEE